jgi:hypothetical protein
MQFSHTSSIHENKYTIPNEVLVSLGYQSSTQLEGEIRKQATTLHSTSAVAWFSYGEWCYRQGQKSVASSLSAEESKLRITSTELKQLLSIMKEAQPLHNLDDNAQRDLIEHIDTKIFESFAEDITFSDPKVV